MAETRPHPISIDDAIAALRFLPDRTPTTTAEESSGAFDLLATCGDRGIFVGHWAGNSEWERHPAGDEIVMILDGDTTISFLAGDDEHSERLGPGQFVVVPQGTWHRFETPKGVKLLSVTPQPTDHRTDRPV